MRIFDGNLFYILLIPEVVLLFRQVYAKMFNFRELLTPIIIGAIALAALYSGGSRFILTFGLIIPVLTAGVGGVISGIRARVEKRAGGISAVSGGIAAVVMPLAVLLIWLAAGVVTGVFLAKSTVAAALLVFAVYLAVRGTVVAFRISGNSH